MMNYIRLTQGLKDKGKLIPENADIKPFITKDKDYYTSVYKYSDEQYTLFKKQGGSVAGIENVFTDKLFLDIDNKTDLSESQARTITLVEKLVNLGFDGDAINVYFSGNKGFHVIVNLDTILTPEQHKKLASNIVTGFVDLDWSIYNASRIFRLTNTKHQESGLYKISITPDELYNCTPEQIKELAKNPRNLTESSHKTSISPELIELITNKKEKPKLEKIDIIESQIMPIEWAKKPPYLTNCRYALLNGQFLEGSRRTAFMIIAASFKNQGFPIEVADGMLQGIIEKQGTYAKSLNKFSDYFPIEEAKQIVEEIYNPNWRNGQFTCKKEGTWLYEYCKNLKEHRCVHDRIDENNTVKITDVTDHFNKYAENYENNVLYTGIPLLDKKWRLMVGTSNALLASPGAGKSSIALQILRNNSDRGIPCIFFSYDMYFASVYTRMIQQLKGWTYEQIFAMYKQNREELKKASQELSEAYKNVQFCFKSGQSIEEIKHTIRHTQQEIGNKVKLIIVDYSELVSTESSDPTHASAIVAQGMREIAMTEDVCVLTLLQPRKANSNPADDFTFAAAAKGSGSIIQALTTLVGLSRPGFDPTDRTGTKDQYVNLTCLKNRNGGLFNLDFKWNGIRGTIDEMDASDEIVLSEIRKAKEVNKRDDDQY